METRVGPSRGRSPTRLEHVPVGALPLARFESVLDPEEYAGFVEAFARANQVFGGRVVWNVNSTARGGGVAEMLRSLLAYERGAGVDARWVVIQGEAEFFAITKRIHNRLHGFPGDGGPLGPDEAEVYRRVVGANAQELAALVSPGDVVVVHDPQPAGACGPLKEAGATVVWRCHVGLDLPNDLAREAWDFLRPHVEPADAYVFSRLAYAWEGLDERKVAVIPPVIDAFSPKNQEMDRGQVESILAASGTVDAAPRGHARFLREDGTPATVERPVEYVGGERPPADASLVVQVSRWDRLKDPVGVIAGFVDHVLPRADAHVVVAGPTTMAVADDPEGQEVLAEASAMWERLPAEARGRVHLACIPMEDTEENAAIVNALQRRADVVVQKSLAEGFGLTVAEAMWKARPVVASRIGGIQDQVVDGETGLLVDPHDLAAFGAAVVSLLDDPERASAMGRQARARVRQRFLGPRHLLQQLDLVAALLDGGLVFD